MPENNHVPLHHMRPSFAFLVRASFANKQNSTAKGWGFGAQCLCVEPELSPCAHKKKSTPTYVIFFSVSQNNIPIFFKKTSIT
jgi:hypothetical protein